MKEFFSIIYIRPTSGTEEKISVGLMAGKEKSPWFDFSDRKLRIARDIIGKETYKSIKKTLSDIYKELEHKNTADNLQRKFFSDSPFSIKYLNYLSNYSNGMLDFSKPVTLGDSINKVDFEELFSIYVDSEKEKKSGGKSSFKESVKSELNKDIFKSRANTFYRIESGIVSTIYRPYEVDFISSNGSIMAGKAVNFKSTAQTIDNHLNKFRSLSEGLRKFASKHKLNPEEGKYVVYFNEPEGKDQKKLLEYARKDISKPFELKELERIVDEEKELKEKNFHKFTDLLES